MQFFLLSQECWHKSLCFGQSWSTCHLFSQQLCILTPVALLLNTHQQQRAHKYCIGPWILGLSRIPELSPEVVPCLYLPCFIHRPTYKERRQVLVEVGTTLLVFYLSIAFFAVLICFVNFECFLNTLFKCHVSLKLDS